MTDSAGTPSASQATATSSPAPPGTEPEINTDPAIPTAQRAADSAPADALNPSAQAIDSGASIPASSPEASPSPAGSGTVATELADGIGASTGSPEAGMLGETLGNGGPVLLVLALLSVAALSILLVKLWQFARLRLNASEPADRALRFWYQYAPSKALAAVEGSTQPTARLLEQAFRGLALPSVDIQLLREELTRFATAQLEQLRAWLRALEVIAALSPLLGLLGTVLGMIEAFRQLELAGSQVNPALLSGGIWQALLTTAAGLGVAIPVVLLHSWLERRVERCGHQMEDALTRVFTRGIVEPRRPDSANSIRSPGLAPKEAIPKEPTTAGIRHAL
ncbi:MotA/TolQ/ExbB proton channel family protein [Halochromatium glycolicum]|uniref:MotA/TolQ/ExbB proton channel domain-containing protein n=1 Tax=Halochromatium glycolicum TaxID=85075 RepID=A0AAJ0XBW6_9GAMM|nr:hypothetical protein [Halochromatium glycolicum]